MHVCWYSISLFECFDNHCIQNDFSTIEICTYYEKGMHSSFLHAFILYRHHRSCLSMCSNDYRDLEGTNVVWLCCKCDSFNCDSFTFRSYELQTSNSFHPLTQIDSSIDSVHSSVFSPLHTSSPKNRNYFSNSGKKASIRSTSSTSSTYHEPFPDMPKKQNLRIMNINCRSVKENKSEFKVAVDYIKPDIICGTE